MEKIEIDYLANNQQFLEEIASYWCKEWSSTWDEKAIAKKVEKLKKKAQIGKLPFLFVAKKKKNLLLRVDCLLMILMGERNFPRGSEGSI